MEQDKDQLFERLLTEYISQTISSQDKELLFSMILETEVYKKEFEEAVKLNTLLHLPHFKSNKDTDHILLKKKIHSTSNAKNKNITWYTTLRKVAAAILILVTVSFGSIYLYKGTIDIDSSLSLTLIEAATPLGGQTRLLLPDGSVAWINAKTELKYSSGFGTTNRHIQLEGEAYFEVNKNDRLPFAVYAGDMEVIATGTIFNVRSYTDDNKWEVDLLEGGVDVLVSNKCYTLRSDEKAIYDRATSSVTIESCDAYLAAVWTKGRFSFYQASIPDIYKMLERHFNVRIQIDSEELKDEYFLGSINMEMSLSEILSYLDVDKKYRIELKDDVIIVRKK